MKAFHHSALCIILCAILAGYASCAAGAAVEAMPATKELIWRSFGSGLYITAYGGNRKLPYAQAKRFCNQEGGNLITVWNETRNGFLRDRFARLYWVGLECPTATTCTWADGEPIEDKTVWLDGEPRVATLLGSNRTCGAAISVLVVKDPLAITPTTSSLLVDTDTQPGPPPGPSPPQYLSLSYCDTPHGFFCRTVDPPVNATAMYRVLGTPKPLWYSMFRTPLLTFKEAEAFCGRYNGSLLSLNSRDDMQPIKQLLTQGYWIGAKGTTDGLESSMIWEDGSVSPTAYATWQRADTISIKSINGRDTCVSYTEYTADWYWQDCNLALQFICQSPPRQRHQAITAKSYGAKFLFFAQPLPFSEAHAVCAAAGAQLAVVGSAFENREIACRASLFLGGLQYYVGHLGDNRTVLGGPSNYQPYVNPGKPPAWSSRSCMLVGWPDVGQREASWLTSAWWPVPCSEPHAFVCKSGTFQLPAVLPISHDQDPPSASIPSPSPPNNSLPPAAKHCCSKGKWRVLVGTVAAACMLAALLAALLVWRQRRRAPKEAKAGGSGQWAQRKAAPFAWYSGLQASALHATATQPPVTLHAMPPGRVNGQHQMKPGGGEGAVLRDTSLLPDSARGSQGASALISGSTSLYLALPDGSGIGPGAGANPRSAGGPDMTLRLEVDVVVQWNRLLGRGTSGAVYAGVLRGQAVAVKMLRREPTDGWREDAAPSSRGEPPVPGPDARGVDAPAGSLQQQQSEQPAAANAPRPQETAAALKLSNFQQEARILGQVRHPNVVALQGGCLQGPDVFLVYELMECSLADLLHGRAARPLPLGRVLDIVRDVAGGLWQLHPHVIHCDLKAANILLSSHGRAKISDFGVAHIAGGELQGSSAASHIAGTLPYMAPERLQGLPVTDKCDVYSLGVILWECFARRKPWHGLDKLSIIYQVCMERKRPEIPSAATASWPSEVCALIERCWSHDPRDRPTAAELVKRLAALLTRLQHGDPLQGRSTLVATSSGSWLSSAGTALGQQHSLLAASSSGGLPDTPLPSSSSASQWPRSADGALQRHSLVYPEQLLHSPGMADSGSDSSAMFSTGSFSQPLDA